MFLAVWVLYAGDRLLDSQPLRRHAAFSGELQVRHLFHHRHRSAFLFGIGVASVGLSFLVPQLNPATLRLDLTLGLLLAGYFILIHAGSAGRRLPKELAVGLFFSAATFIPTVARAPALRAPLAPLAILFAALCCLNGVCIYAWEHSSGRSSPHPLTRIAVSHLRAIAVILTLAALTLSVLSHQAAPLAVALSAIALLLLHRHHRSVTPTVLRASADLALLTPAALLPWLLLHR